MIHNFGMIYKDYILVCGRYECNLYRKLVNFCLDNNRICICKYINILVRKLKVCRCVVDDILLKFSKNELYRIGSDEIKLYFYVNTSRFQKDPVPSSHVRVYAKKLCIKLCYMLINLTICLHLSL